MAEFIEDWEKKNNKTFRVGGVRFMDFIKRQWEDFKVQRETEKEQRVSEVLAADTTEVTLLTGIQTVDCSGIYNADLFSVSAFSMHKKDGSQLLIYY